MAYDRSRPLPDETSPLSSSIPEAPPLPLARSVFDRFRVAARKATPQGLVSDASKDDAAIITSKFGGPASSLSTSHKTGLKLRALDINQTRTHVVLAGVKILKTVRLDDDPSCTEDFNLRTAAVNYAGVSSASAQEVPSRAPRAFVPEYTSAQRELFDIEDVAWSNNLFRDYIATAARNGKIMLYDMSRPSVEVGSLHEHFRQVHKVDFNPMEGACLLSGSQDGTVRLWDLRNYRKNSMVVSSMNTFPGRSEGVRHVKWSPRDTWSFAFGTDNGVIQRWDTRQNRQPVLKFSAHNQTCNSIDWHPDGKHLVSAGKDQVVKVWNILPDARGGVVFSVRTPREVQNVRWRPPCFVTGSQDQGIKQCTHFATSYRHMPLVHVWDLRRPYLPFREIHHRVNSGTTDMLWRSKDLLWTVGPEGEFSQTDVPFAPKSIDRRPLSVVSCAPDGELSFASKTRASRSWTSADIEFGISADGHGPPGSSDRLPFGRSPGDDSFDEKFLGPSVRKRHSRAASIKSGKSLGATPPSTDEMARMVTMDLKVTMDAYDQFRPGQPAKFGNLPGTTSPGIFSYLAQKYKKPPTFWNLSLAYLQNITSVFAQNATYAQRASLYRDSQTWKVLGFIVSQELQKRVEHNKQARKHHASIDRPAKSDLPASDIPKTSSPKSLDSGAVAHVSEPLEASKPVQSFSNVPTPVVRPVRTHSNETEPDPDIDVPEDVGLPPSVTTDLQQKLDEQSSVNGDDSGAKFKAKSPQPLRGQDAFDLRQREAAMAEWTTQRRAPYSLETTAPQHQNASSRPSFDRRESSDSFMIFSTSSDSQPRTYLDSSFRSNFSTSGGRYTSQEQDRLRYNTSFQSTESAQSKSSSRRDSQDSGIRAYMEDGESFQDLPTNANMLVDDFVDSERKSNSVQSNDQDLSRAPSQELSIIDFATDESPSVNHHPSPIEWPSKENGLSKGKPMFNKSQGGDRDGPRKTKVDTLTKLAQTSHSRFDTTDKTSSNHQAEIISDYLIPTKNKMHGDPPALRADSMLREVLIWYSSRGDAQMAAQIFLLTASILAPPGSFPNSDESSNSSLSTAYLDHLTSPPLSMPTEAARTILQTFHAPLDTLDIPPVFAESMLSTYHDQLLASSLLNAAAGLRRLSYPAFPAVFEQGLKDIEIGTLCLGCNNPINNPTNKMRCESCHEQQSECAICLCLESPFELPGAKKSKAKTEGSPAAAPHRNQHTERPDEMPPANAALGSPRNMSAQLKLHTCCVLCNHVTHTACSIAWFSDSSSPSSGSGGACPVPGCLCDCVRGYYRNQRLQKLEARERQKRNAGAGVRRDDWNIGESRAVGRVRGALRGSASPFISEEARSGSYDAARGSHLEASSLRRGGLADHGRTMSDEAKRVRLVAPDGTDS